MVKDDRLSRGKHEKVKKFEQMLRDEEKEEKRRKKLRHVKNSCC